MANYTNKLGDIYTQEELEAAALENGVDIDTIITDNELIQEAPGKGKSATAKGSTVAPKKKRTLPTATESASSSKSSLSESNGKNPFGKEIKTFSQEITEDYQAIRKKRPTKTAAKTTVKNQETDSYAKAMQETMDYFTETRNREAASLEPAPAPGSFGRKKFEQEQEVLTKKAQKEKEKKEEETTIFSAKVADLDLKYNDNASQGYKAALQASQLNEEDNNYLDSYIQNELARNGKNMVSQSDMYSRVGYADVEPHVSFEKQRKTVIQRLKKDGLLNKYSEEQILQEAALEWRKQEEVKIREDKFTRHLANNSDITEKSKEIIKNYTIAKGKNSALTYINSSTARNELVKEQADIEDQIIKIDSQLKPKNYKFTAQEEVDAQNALINEREELVGYYNKNNDLAKALENKISRSSDEVKDLTFAYDMFKRDYSTTGSLKKRGTKVVKWLNEGGGLVGYGFDFLVNSAIQATKIGPAGTYRSTLTDTAAANALGFDEYINNTFEKDLNSFETPGEVLKHTGDLVLDFVPDLLLMIFTGGQSTIAKEAVKQAAKKSLSTRVVSALAVGKETLPIGARVASSKYLDMVNEQKNGYYDESGTKIMPNYSTSQLMFVPAAYGYMEAVGEKATAGIIKRNSGFFKLLKETDPKAYSDFGNNFFKKFEEVGLKDYLKNTGKGIIKGQLEEQPAEFLTYVGQDLADKFLLGKEVNLLEHTGEVFKDTGLLTIALTGAPMVGGLLIKPFMSQSNSDKMVLNSIKLIDIEKRLSQEDLTDIQRVKLESEKEQINSDMQGIIGNTVDNINDMPSSVYNSVSASATKVAAIVNKAKEINESDIDQETKDADIAALKREYLNEKSVLNSLTRSIESLNTFGKPINSITRGELIGLQAERVAVSFNNNLSEKQKDNVNAKIEKRIEAIYAANDVNINEERTKEYEQNLKVAQKLATSSNVLIVEGNNKNDLLAKAKLRFKNNEISEADLNDLNTMIKGKAEGGFSASGNVIFIQKDLAVKRKAVTVGSHEFLHKLLQKTMQNASTQINLGEALANHLIKINPELYLNNAVVERQYGNYDKEDAGNFNEELLTIFSDALLKGDVKYNESVFTKLGDIIRRLFQDLGLSNIEFNSGVDVYNFIKDYNNTIAKGKDLNKAQKQLLAGGAKGSLISDGIENKPTIKQSKSANVLAIEKKIQDLEDQYYNDDDLDYDDYENRSKILKANLAKAIAAEKEKPKEEAKPEVKKKEVVKTDETEVKEIIAESKGTISSDKVQQIYNEKGVEGALDIIKLFAPITKKIVDKRRDAPGFDRELLTDEIETGVGGILDLISKYDPKEGTPLAAYINKYLPVRAITASRRVLDKDFKKDAAEEKGLMATETADSGFVELAKEKPTYKNALESKLLTPEELKTAESKILTVVRTLKNRIDAPISINRTVTPIIAEIRDAMGKQLDIDLKTIMGGKKDGVLRKWLLDHKRYVLENMTTTWLMGADGKGGIPQAIQKRIDGRWVNYPNWVGKKVDREAMSTDNAGRTSGAELARRLPNVFNNVSDADYLGQILEVDGNPIRGRKESLAKAVAEELAFDIINNDLANEGEIFDALSKNQERLGVEITEVLSNEFIKQADRGNVKLSSSKASSALFILEQNGWNKNSKEFKDFVSKLTTAEEESVSKFFKNKRVERLIMLFRNIWETNQGVKYEKDTFSLLRSKEENLNKYNIKLAQNVPDRFNSHEYDLVLKQNDQITNIELKNSFTDYMGSTSNGKFLEGIYFTKSFEGLEDLKTEMESNINRSEFIKKLNDLLAKNDPNIRITKYGNIQITNKLYKELDRTLASTQYNKLNINALSDINFGKDILQIKDSGAFAFPSSKYANTGQFNIIDSNLLVSVEFRTSSAGKGWKNIRERAYFTLPENFSKSSNIDLNSNPDEFIKRINASNEIIKLQDSNKTEQELSNALMKLSVSKEPKGISVFDFDDTIGITEGNVLYIMPNGDVGKLNAEEFAKEGSRLLSEGAEFDFSEFTKVINGKPGPMVEKMKKMIGKFGPENFFILTARPQAAAGPIHNFLSSIGIDIPLENITGLGNSTGKAKADWMVSKAAEGYNDFYFSDDAMQNITAVKEALDVLDVKSKIQQAKAKFSKSMSDEFNKIIEENKGVESYKVYSDIVAKRRGAGKNRFDLFVPPSAADFELLLYKFMGKGERGEEQQKFFDEALLKPYINGVNLMDGARQSIKKSYKALTKAFPDVQKKLKKLSPDKDFTYDQAIRVALWNDAGIEIPGLTQRDNKKLVEMVNGDTELLAFKEGLKAMSRQEKGWVEPSEYWDTDTIVSDLFNITQSGGRKKFLGEFIENVETIFGKWEAGKLVGPNMNKIQAVYGTNVREALEDSLYRMINGKNRSYGQDRETSMWTNWVTGSTGVIMFLNTRSAVLQLLSTANFLNLRDNNPIAVAKAFANQKQYWNDFATIWNSDKMKERRGGLREDVVASEIANAAAGSKNKAAAVISYLLKIGYTPTQLADSFAISSGGAPYYRNRIKTHISEGMSETEAEKLAWEEFSKIADETQQSGDPKDISKQQASGAGRLLLTFQNTAMQQSRLVKKAFLDLKNGRGDAKTNIAKISYYLIIQNTIFSVLQQGLFAVLFDEDEEEAKRKKNRDEKAVDLANGVLDSILRGTGFYGGIAATLKNVAVKYMEQQDKKQKDYAKVVIEAANISPPIGSKLRKLYAGLKQTEQDKDLIAARGWGVMQDGRVHLGPMYSVTGKGAEVLLNVPVDRLVNKIENVSQALNNQNKAWQRAAVALGFTPWTVGIEKTPGDLKIIEEAKAKRKIEGLAKAEITREKKSKALKDSIKSLTPFERSKYRRLKALEKREKAIARSKKRRMGGD